MRFVAETAESFLLIRPYKVPFEAKHTPRVRRIIERRTIPSSLLRRARTAELLFAIQLYLVVSRSVHWVIR